MQPEKADVPWRKVINQRNALVHEYGEIKHELLWRVASERIAELIKMLDPLVPQSPGDKEI